MTDIIITVIYNIMSVPVDILSALDSYVILTNPNVSVLTVMVAFLFAEATIDFYKRLTAPTKAA